MKKIFACTSVQEENDGTERSSKKRPLNQPSHRQPANSSSEKGERYAPSTTQQDERYTPSTTQQDERYTPRTTQQAERYTTRTTQQPRQCGDMSRTPQGKPSASDRQAAKEVSVW